MESSDTVNMAAHMLIDSGYGLMAEYIAVGMKRTGAQVNLLPGWNVSPMAHLLPETVELFRSSRQYEEGPILFSHAVESRMLDQCLIQGDVVIHTMWEASELPAGWSDEMNRARAVVAPTRYVADVFRRSGVKVPIEVVPDGVDPAVYNYKERPERPGLTTLIVATARPRKHMDHAIRAWQLAFADDKRARLLIRTDRASRLTPEIARDQRVVVEEREEGRGISDLYQIADVCLALGSEGFGLPAVEAMATGLPVVALNSEGQQDLCRDAYGLVLPVHPAYWEQISEPWVPGARGLQGVPDIAEAARMLRWVAKNRSEATALGAAASRWALDNRDVWLKGPRLLEIVHSM